MVNYCYRDTQPYLNGYKYEGSDTIHVTFDAKSFCSKYAPQYSDAANRRKRTVRAIASAVLIGLFLGLVTPWRMLSWSFIGWWVGLWMLYNCLVGDLVKTEVTERAYEDYSIWEYTSLKAEGNPGLKADGEPDNEWMNAHYRWKAYRVATLITMYLDADRKIRYVDAARVDAVTLAYVYDELCYLIRDENFHEVLWERMGEFAPEEEDDYLEYSENDEDCEEEDDCDNEAEDEYADAEDRIRERVIANHGRVVEALRSVGPMNVLLAFHASCGKPMRIAVEEDGEEYEDELVWDYESFCRYVTDADCRADEINGMDVEEYAPAYEWLENDAEMLEPCA